MYSLPKLPYSYDAFVQIIDARTMEIHYTKHHQAYCDKLNAALEQYPELKERDLTNLLSNLSSLPEGIRMAVRNNGGGHYNHTFFWGTLGVDCVDHPSGKLADRINETFGDFESFKKAFHDTGLARFGSGWVWLVKNNEGELSVISTPNQDSPCMENLGVPLLGLDLWEHAYYLHYQNRRTDYINAWWGIVNWFVVEERYNK